MVGYQIRKKSGFGDEFRIWTDAKVFTNIDDAMFELVDESRRQQINCCTWSDCTDPLSVEVQWNEREVTLIAANEVDYITLDLRIVEIC